MIIETKKIYKTDDGRTFNTEAEAISHENKIKEKTKQEAKLSSLKEELDRKLDKAVKAYDEYSKAFNAYADEHKKIKGEDPYLLSEELNKLLDLLF